MASQSSPTPRTATGPFPLLAAFLRVDQTFGVLDGCLAAVATLMFVTSRPATLLHVLFLCLTTGAMYWRLPGFAGRSLVWVTLASLAMVSGATEGKVTPQELLQLPLLSLILLLVFLLARQRARMARRLEEVTGCDPLTGLPGRDRFVQSLDSAIASAADQGLAIAVLSLDLDGLKAVNEEHGHQAGDQLLIETAKRLRSVVRAGDLVARVGGDEFMILLTAEASAIPRIVERIIDAMQQPVLLDGRPVSVTVSAGVALAEQPALRLRDDIVRHAEAALRRVKAAGKAGYEVFSPVAA